VATREAFSRLGVLLEFSPVFVHNLLRAIGDGIRSYVSCFLLLRLPVVCFALSRVVFCLDFSLSFFFSSIVPLLGVFHLFIYFLPSMKEIHMIK
jgi:hypothetical protein